MDRGELSLSHS